MFDSVLIANRGEIAVRIIRTLDRLAIRSIAVHSDADADARHVHAADVAIGIGPAAAVESYLSVHRIVEAALAAGADAIHPGYGFLSENVALVDACDAAGLVFIGPPRAAILAMGDKIRAKATVAAAGVRTVPGSEGARLDDGALVAAAERVGFPVLLKPSAGGGGKGMHLVRDASSMPPAIASARREAISAFGDDDLLVERFVEHPRHIEIQVLADAHDSVVHFGERECSLQRRHQKVVEEAPSAFLDDAARAAMGAQAVAAARACGYVNAGTVEFIVSGDDPADAFFLEMNTRLQVEHPVTEMAWGVDLVELQLRIAAGEPLPFRQDDLRPRGHAVEARVYAEDPQRGFLPTGGRVLALTEPCGDGIRVDSALACGLEVGATYDPMLAKVVAWAPRRADALHRLDRALGETNVLGVTTNIAFLRRLLLHPDVVAGRLDTGLIERDLELLVDDTIPDDVVAAAALSSARRETPSDAWDAGGGWRIGEHAPTHWSADVDGRQISVVVRPAGASHTVRIGNGDAVTARLTGVDAPTGTAAALQLGDRTSRLLVARDGPVVWVARDGASWSFREPEAIRSTGAVGAGSATGAVTSPMPGTVVAIAVVVGEDVSAGVPVVVVEAMKMEHTVVAPRDGRVTQLSVAIGQKVALGQVLARIDDTIDPDTSDPDTGADTIEEEDD